MDRSEVVSKVKRLVETRFDGDWEKGFRHYSGSDGRVSGDDLCVLLKDAGVGSFLTRSLYVSKILDVLDRDGDGAISQKEFWFVFLS